MKIRKRSDGADVSADNGTAEEKTPKSSRKMELNVILYTVILFVAALALILLSYAIQQRAVAAAPEESGLYDTLDGEAGEDDQLTLEDPTDGNGGTQP